MQKMDIFKRKMWYSYHSEPSHFIELNLDKVQEIVSQNKKGEQPDSLEIFVQAFVEEPKHDYENVVGQDSITRFDTQKGKKSNKKGNQRPKRKTNPRSQNELQSQEAPAKSSNTTNKGGQSQKKQSDSKRSSSNRRRRNGQKNSANRSKKNEENKSE